MHNIITDSCKKIRPEYQPVTNLRHHYAVCENSDGTFYNFSVTLNVKIKCARDYKNLLNFVKVMPKEILVVPFFLDTVYIQRLFTTKANNTMK